MTGTAVGYSGGKLPTPTYRSIKDHTECLLIRFDPAVVSYSDLVDRFWRSHSPFSGSPRGQYRSLLAYLTPEQQVVAEASLARVAAAGNGRAVTTAVEPATDFYRAEEYHQNYFAKNPSQGYCLAVAAPKVAKFRKTFARLAKP